MDSMNLVSSLAPAAPPRALNSLGLPKAPADTRVVVAMSGGVDSSVVAALLVRLLFIRTAIDPYVGPRALVYPSLAVLVTLVLWVAFFRV